MGRIRLPTILRDGTKSYLPISVIIHMEEYRRKEEEKKAIHKKLNKVIKLLKTKNS